MGVHALWDLPGSFAGCSSAWAFEIGIYITAPLWMLICVHPSTARGTVEWLSVPRKRLDIRTQSLTKGLNNGPPPLDYYYSKAGQSTGVVKWLCNVETMQEWMGGQLQGVRGYNGGSRNWIINFRLDGNNPKTICFVELSLPEYHPSAQ